ncbi:pyridoxal phosphate-dependent aminotransferase [Bifidobacterium avesanii]|uniref:Aminotransferase class I/II-fold pyridoxal phosphate-dependent enzyme n=1 Tax=Bifidobacterium avesanii TaxID=1798157 RepID=A0A7K3THZ9_9BIFI|nr:aminotransferase class I/II-fold pyridoxal phosphate-dependent enzyme [Bifidobacterium avesanii]KAB8291488.1 diaminopimelate aminotransferase [Bifidobacterium avesanii]NEG77883.1 aminotransferase class I/II-fold pyridoxal phosphate-dependent enzyme [Bifidobacterium avesanii]
MPSTPSPIASLISKRALALPGNPFAEADARAAAAVAAGEDVIDLSKGNPDGQPPEFVKDALARAAYEPADFRYAPFDGKPAYIRAAAGWYARRHGVTLDPATELLATSGSSVGIDTVIEALVDEGDTVLAVEPYYPQYEGSAAVAKGRFVTIPTDAAHGFLPDLDAVDPVLLDEAKLLILNYPNNPTGAVATPELYAAAVRLAKKHHFAVMNDFAYARLGFDERPAISLLETPGAKDVAVELCSLSKMYMVAGWRGGFVAGNADVLAAAKAVHRQTTVLAPSVIQDAGTAALNSDQSSVAALAGRYRRRYEVLHDGLNAAGFRVLDSHGGLFAWMEVPAGAGSSDQFTDFLLHTAGVAVMPGSCFGASGEGYVRLSLLKPEEDLAEAVRRIAAKARP